MYDDVLCLRKRQMECEIGEQSVALSVIDSNACFGWPDAFDMKVQCILVELITVIITDEGGVHYP